MKIRRLEISGFKSFADRVVFSFDDGITWLGDYGEAIHQAKQTNKPIFLEFRCEA